MKTQVSKIIRLEPEKAVPFFEEPTDVTATIRAKLAASRFDQHTPPPPEPPVMLICGVEVAHAGNLVVIEGPNKSGKSAFYGAGIAAIMGKNAGDCLGWESDGNPDGGAVLHFDTEQSRGDHHSVIMKAQARAGVRETPAWFDSYCLTGWELAEARLSIRIALDDARAACGSVHSLWLDGGAADPQEVALTIVQEVTTSLAGTSAAALTSSVSIGIALTPHHGSEIGGLLAVADAALYEAKAAGRRSARLAA